MEVKRGGYRNTHKACRGQYRRPARSRGGCFEIRRGFSLKPKFWHNFLHMQKSLFGFCKVWRFWHNFLHMQVWHNFLHAHMFDTLLRRNMFDTLLRRNTFDTLLRWIESMNPINDSELTFSLTEVYFLGFSWVSKEEAGVTHKACRGQGGRPARSRGGPFEIRRGFSLKPKFWHTFLHMQKSLFGFCRVWRFWHTFGL